MKDLLRINVGCGRIRLKGYVGIDITQFIDGNGKECVDIVMDIERNRLPFENDSVDEIVAENILEHIGFSKDNPDGLEALIFVMNEFHRVLKPTGILRGNVPPFGSNGAIRDITHKRFFVKESFAYLTGQNEAKLDRPGHPKYADYGVLPYYLIYLDDGITFKLRPRKTVEYDKRFEKEDLSDMQM